MALGSLYIKQYRSSEVGEHRNLSSNGFIRLFIFQGGAVVEGEKLVKPFIRMTKQLRDMPLRLLLMASIFALTACVHPPKQTSNHHIMPRFLTLRPGQTTVSMVESALENPAKSRSVKMVKFNH